HLPAGARGAVWLDGERREVRDLLERSPSLTLGRLDYGVISMGAASYFFQHVELPPKVRRSLSVLDGDAVLSQGLSFFLHAAVRAAPATRCWPAAHSRPGSALDAAASAPDATDTARTARGAAKPRSPSRPARRP